MPFLEPTDETAEALLRRGIDGPITMLNLLRFRDVADYSADPDLAPSAPISGAEAYRRYAEHTMPHLLASGGEVIFEGSGGEFFIGPTDERWDHVLLVRQASLDDFFAFASNEAYLAGLGRARRLAAAPPQCGPADVSDVALCFRPLVRDDFGQLVEWFAEPAIARWWDHPAELDFMRTKYGPRIDGEEPTSMWIVEIDGEPAGLLQHYRHVDYPAHDAVVGVPDAVGIDYLIGSQHRGRGLAAPVLRAFARHALTQRASMSVCVATPAQENTASWRALERAGFDRHGECTPPDGPIEFIYVIDRSQLDD